MCIMLMRMKSLPLFYSIGVYQSCQQPRSQVISSTGGGKMRDPGKTTTKFICPKYYKTIIPI